MRNPLDRFWDDAGGGPPVGTGLGFDAVAVGVERNTVRGGGGIEVGEGVEMPVGDGRIDMDPEGPGGVQVRRVGRQVDAADAFGHLEAGGGLRAGTLRHAHDDALAHRPGLAGEQREGSGEDALVDAAREMTCNSRRSQARRRR